jgi:hypothetical protein
VYLIGAWGSQKEFPPAGGYDVWNLDATNESVLADWVASGGKLIVAVDYRQFRLVPGTLPNGSTISDAYGVSLNGLLAACGSTLSVTPTDIIGASPVPRPTDTFLTTSLTTGIAGDVGYDGQAGSVISGGTLCFDGHPNNQIRFENLVGGGLVVLFGSRNTMWGETDWAAMSEFLQRIIDL